MAKRKKSPEAEIPGYDDTAIISIGLSMAISEEIGFAVRPLRQFVPQIIAGNPPTMDEVKKVMLSVKYGDNETLLDFLQKLFKGQGNPVLK